MGLTHTHTHRVTHTLVRLECPCICLRVCDTHFLQMSFMCGSVCVLLASPTHHHPPLHFPSFPCGPENPMRTCVLNINRSLIENSCINTEPKGVKGLMGQGGCWKTPEENQKQKLKPNQ